MLIAIAFNWVQTKSVTKLQRDVHRHSDRCMFTLAPQTSRNSDMKANEILSRHMTPWKIRQQLLQLAIVVHQRINVQNKFVQEKNTSNDCNVLFSPFLLFDKGHFII
jgi:precorrin-6x reductase